jgi:predicted GTPase
MAKISSCHQTATANKRTAVRGSKPLTVALAGNANVGKSVIFNQLTGSQQTIGNWPGKTVERAEGRLHFDGREVTVVDLPGSIPSPPSRWKKSSHGSISPTKSRM